MKKKRSTKGRVVKKSSSRKKAVKFNIKYLSFAVVGMVLMSLIVMIPEKANLTQSVAGVKIAQPLFGKSTVTWANVDGAVAYNVYYKKADEPNFTDAVRGIHSNATSVSISYLRKGVEYNYQVTALDRQGKEFWHSDILDLPDPQ